MTKEIDWSKAPEGATHALTTGPRWDGSSILAGEIRYAVRRDKGYVEVGDPEDATFCMGKRSWVVVAKRPAPWTGEGLPPVGIECESLWNSKSRDYLRVKVLAHDGDVAIIRWLNGDRVFELQGRAQEEHEGVPVFRPIRTPEQIAAEERENFLREVGELFSPREPYDARTIGERIYNAGYRKKERQK